MKNYNKMQTYLSNLAVLNAKLHNIHWNVEGKEFMQIHKFTEEIYEDLFKKFDEVAELLKMKDEMPLVKMDDYADKSTIKEESSRSFDTEESLKIVLEDLKEMKEMATEIRNAADKDGDFQVVGEMEGHVDYYSLKIWFMQSMLA